MAKGTYDERGDTPDNRRGQPEPGPREPDSDHEDQHRQRQHHAVRRYRIEPELAEARRGASQLPNHNGDGQRVGSPRRHNPEPRHPWKKHRIHNSASHTTGRLARRGRSRDGTRPATGTPGRLQRQEGWGTGSRCIIGRVEPTGEGEAIYCHRGSPPERNGVILLRNYQEPESVRRLISLGRISSLVESLDDMVRTHPNGGREG